MLSRAFFGGNKFDNIPSSISIYRCDSLNIRRLCDARFAGRPARPEDTASANYRLVSPGYLQAMGIPLKRGRDFNEYHKRESAPVALINETLAKHSMLITYQVATPVLTLSECDCYF